MTKTERSPATRPEKSRAPRTKPALPAGPDYWPLPTQHTARRRGETGHLPGEARPTPAP
jgi:hypothetical protein